MFSFARIDEDKQQTCLTPRQKYCSKTGSAVQENSRKK